MSLVRLETSQHSNHLYLHSHSNTDLPMVVPTTVPIASVKQNPDGGFYPPLDGSLFLTEMIEFNAKYNPSRPFYVFYDEKDRGLHYISHLEFYRACQRMAHAVRPNRHGLDNNEVVAIIANSDTILYQALIMGVIYAGLIPFPISPRNSSPAVANMMQKTGCCRLIATQNTIRALLDGVRRELALLGDTSIQLRVDEPPALAYAYPKLGKEVAGTPFVPYPKAEKRPVNNDIMLYLHSSGSTGFPKPIPITYGICFHWCITPSFLDRGDIPTDVRISAAALPSFHTVGVYFQLLIAQTRKTFAVPAFLEEWVASAHAVKILSSLERVMFAGGPLAKKTGDALVAAGVKLSNLYGTTETAIIALSNPTEPKLWEWATSDAFVKHPTIEGLYKIIGRLDDVLIHSSGEKTVPAPMETVIGNNCFLSGVCMFGRGHSQVGVLVEPRPEYAIDVTDDKQVAGFRNIIWPEVKEANEGAPTFSRIFKEMILVTSKDKPMPRTGKGTVMKKATIKHYEPEIEALFDSVEASTKAGIDVPIPSDWVQSEVENWLMVHATAVNSDKPVEVDEDLFKQAFDSLSSTFLKNRIVGSLGTSSNADIREAASRISQNIIFLYPTIRRLARYLIRLVVSKDASSTTEGTAEIEDMITKYSVGLAHKVGSDKLVNGSSSNGHASYTNKHAVLLTGSTGGLGSYLLASLLRNEEVTVVYAFDRPSRTRTINERQRAAFEDRGLDTALLSSEKLVHVEGDADKEKLGVDDNLYDELCYSLTVIIHNAWRLDFNLSLSSFEPNVRGTRNLIDLALSSKRSSKPRFLFTSSIASAQGWAKSKGAFPEEVRYDSSVAAGPGYGASKYVCERILVNSGLPGSSFRIGQISGGTRGAWSTTDWVPILVKSSVTLRALPEARGVASWLPPHAVSDAILDVAFAQDEPPIAVNLVHPRPVEWVSLMKPINIALYQKNLTPELLPLVPFDQWVASLEKCAADTSEDNIRRVPAIKLLNFMRSIAQEDTAIRQSDRYDAEEVGFADFATDVAQRVSKTMRNLKPLSSSDVEKWVDYWESVGMFSDASLRRVYRIFKEMILVTSKDKPMPRTGNGTVTKKATIKLYEPEIEALYEPVEASTKAGIDVPIPSDWVQTEVENWLMVHATAVNSDKPVEVDEDLFNLASTSLRNRIIGFLRASSDKDIREAASRISQNIVDLNPTIRLLARRLIRLVGSKDTFAATETTAEIEDMIAKYSVGLGDKVGSDTAANGTSSNAHANYTNKHVVLLTGSTGGLGSYLLASLLRNEDVTAVYAFNRPSRTRTINERQRATFEDRGLETALLSSEKLVHVVGNADKEKLGLNDNLYGELCDSLTVIIHNAWRLNLNIPLSSFEPNVRGTRNLIDLALSSKRSSKPRFLFTSSVASAHGWVKSKGAFPEEVQYDPSVAVGTGYGARFTLPKVVSWLPHYAVSDAILDIAFAKDEPPIAVNLVHPRPVEWVSLMKPISSALYRKNLTSELLPLVPFAQWLTSLEERAADTSEDNIRRVPAIKLLNFMQLLAQGDTATRQSDRSDAEAVGFTELATDVAQRVSKTMRNLEPLTSSDVEIWVDYWESAGMLSEASLHRV
ncbi:hypothetical protein PAXINDRAFT_97557 [Paxillus involutus ATCC 200175]|nr:hypothetical protein PAXINDRAFT_97557 [Paxillus involutus ATCC 200175]